jgi:hypothetical protein
MTPAGPTTALTSDAAGASAGTFLFSENPVRLTVAAPPMAAVLVTVSNRGEGPIPEAQSSNGTDQMKEVSPITTPAQRKALALGLRYLFPDMTDDQIARAAGVSRRTLFRWAEYTTLKKVQREMYKLPRGSKDPGGNLEAWTDEDE